MSDLPDTPDLPETPDPRELIYRSLQPLDQIYIQQVALCRLKGRAAEIATARTSKMGRPTKQPHVISRRIEGKDPQGGRSRDDFLAAKAWWEEHGDEWQAEGPQRHPPRPSAAGEN